MQGCINNVRLFADDTLLYLTVQNNNDAELLQRDLDMLCQWEATWLMEFHPISAKLSQLQERKIRSLIPITYMATILNM